MTLTDLPGTAHEANLSTDEAATRLKIKPQTLRAAFCRAGHYCGCKPTKRANRFLAWPVIEIDRIAAGLPPTEGVQ